MTNKLVNFDLDNGVLDCNSESIIAFTDFLRKDLEDQIENVKKITEIHNEILNRIKEKLKSDDRIKKYFNNKNDLKELNNREEKIKEIKYNILHLLFLPEIKTDIFFKIKINKDNLNIKEVVESDGEISLECIFENGFKIILVKLFIPYGGIKVVFYSPDNINFIESIYFNDDKFDLTLTDNNKRIEFLEKVFQQQVIKSEKYGNYLYTFLLN